MPSIKYSISLEKQAYCQSKYVPSFCVKTYPVSTHHDWKMWIPQPVGDWLLKVDVTVKLLKIQSCWHREVAKKTMSILWPVYKLSHGEI